MGSGVKVRPTAVTRRSSKPAGMLPFASHCNAYPRSCERHASCEPKAEVKISLGANQHCKICQMLYRVLEMLTSIALQPAGKRRGGKEKKGDLADQ